MKRFVWGGVTAALLLAMSAILGPTPFRLSSQNPPRIANHSNQEQNLRVQITSKQSRAQIAAQDMAISTALCVRDCRFALQDLANRLDHTADPAMRSRLIKDAMQEHPQFRYLVLQTANGQTHSNGTAVQPRYVQESIDGVRKTNQFYLTDLYEGKGKKSDLFLAIALPLVHNSQTVGILAAEVEMGFLRGVADLVDNQMGTISHLKTHDGNPVLFHPEKPHVQGVGEASQNVDGTKWNTSSVHVRPKSRDIRVEGRKNEVVVYFHQEPDEAALKRIMSDIDGVIVKRNHLPVFVFRSKTMSTEQLVAYFRKMGVKLVEPNRTLRQNDHPNDRLYQRYQWNFPQINIENAWKSTTGNPGTVIAVIDTGVDLDHPEFEGQLVEGRNMLDGTNRPQDDNGHGTHVAGVIIARTNNIEGVAGMNWNSKVMPVKALDSEGSGSVFDIADGIRWAADHGAKVINLSLGEYEDSSYLHEAIRYAVSKDIVVVAAMGNDDTGEPSYPAAYPEVLSVTAVDQNSERAPFSNYGEHAGVAAPGVSVASTYLDHRYAAMSGTSMASPHVAGLAGLIRSINPSLSANQVKDIILRTATDLGPKGPDPYFGRGLINVAEAVRQAQMKSQDTGPAGRHGHAERKPRWWFFRHLFGGL